MEALYLSGTTTDRTKLMSAEAIEVIHPWDLAAAKPSSRYRYTSAEQLMTLGFEYNATIGRWVLPIPKQ